MPTAMFRPPAADQSMEILRAVWCDGGHGALLAVGAYFAVSCVVGGGPRACLLLVGRARDNLVDAAATAGCWLSLMWRDLQEAWLDEPTQPLPRNRLAQRAGDPLAVPGDYFAQRLHLARCWPLASPPNDAASLVERQRAFLERCYALRRPRNLS